MLENKPGVEDRKQSTTLIPEILAAAQESLTSSSTTAAPAAHWNHGETNAAASGQRVCHTLSDESSATAAASTSSSWSNRHILPETELRNCSSSMSLRSVSSNLSKSRFRVTGLPICSLAAGCAFDSPDLAVVAWLGESQLAAAGFCVATTRQGRKHCTRCGCCISDLELSLLPPYRRLYTCTHWLASKPVRLRPVLKITESKLDAVMASRCRSDITPRQLRRTRYRPCLASVCQHQYQTSGGKGTVLAKQAEERERNAFIQRRLQWCAALFYVLGEEYICQCGDERNLKVSEAFQVKLKLADMFVQSQPDSVCRADLHIHNHVPASRLEVSNVRGGIILDELAKIHILSNAL